MTETVESEFRERVAQSGEIDDPEPIAEATAPGSRRSPVAVSVARGAALSSGQAEDVAEYLSRGTRRR